jgi:hypothetical protein
MIYPRRQLWLMRKLLKPRDKIFMGWGWRRDQTGNRKAQW